MQTHIADFIKDTDAGQRANEILRKCVHCGFCNATCPTYSILGNELDGPRGRIYLIKQMLEGTESGRKTQLHLDRCLTCLNCETTCPSGVKYGQLLDIGREVSAQQSPRTVKQKIIRLLLRVILPYPARFRQLLTTARLFRPVLPEKLRRKIPRRRASTQFSADGYSDNHTRQMLILDGCVQSGLTPEVNIAASNVLNKLGITAHASPLAGCCGALSYHLQEVDQAHEFIKRNIDAWWPGIESGKEAIVITASGCGHFIKQYGEILRLDSDYSQKAARISEVCKDISEVLDQEDLTPLEVDSGQSVAYHSPCTLQHGQQLSGLVESILESRGYKLQNISDSHMCCGSAGTYSILQPEISERLLERKLENLQQGEPDVIATANIGCQMHLQSRSSLPVRHWIELMTSDYRV